MTEWVLMDDDVSGAKLGRLFFVFRHCYIDKLLETTFGDEAADPNVKAACLFYIIVLTDDFENRKIQNTCAHTRMFRNTFP